MKDMFHNLRNTVQAVERCFGQPHVLVVGDLMLDRYYFGEVERISPEAPVPIIHLRSEIQTPGGAANVAHNLAALGCEVSLAGVVGCDDAQKTLLDRLNICGVNTSAVLIAAERTTTLKTRIIGNHQQMLRMDSEDARPLLPSECEQLLTLLTPGIKRYAAVVLSDYAKGTLTERVCQGLITEARRYSIPILVDPKGDDYRKYAAATMLSPNRTEISLATGSAPTNLESLFDRAESLRATLGVQFIVVTLGELGMALIEHGSVYRCSVAVREVFDVSGAGDTVIAIWAAGMAAGLHRRDCANLANIAAGIVIGTIGTRTISGDELLAALSYEKWVECKDKVCTTEEIEARVGIWRRGGERIVFTNGCFDLFHVGHLALLQHAKKEGTRVIVALNSDNSVRALKGPTRPVIGQDDRARVLSSLSLVDAVVLFEQETPVQLIKALRPDVLVKGADYLEPEVLGADEVRSWGGDVILVPLLEGYSTTNLLIKAQASSSLAIP